MKKAVGFDQKILLNHLNYTANETNDTKKIEMYKKLEQYLIKDGLSTRYSGHNSS